MMFFSLYTILLVFVQVKVNGEKNESVKPSKSKCTNTYPVSHDRQRPSDKYRTGSMKDRRASGATCQHYCNADEKCRSVTYIMNERPPVTSEILPITVCQQPYQEIDDRCVDASCHKYNISVQKLKDTGKVKDIQSNDYKNYLTYITYDRACANLFCPPGKGLYGDVCKSCKENEVSSNGTGPCIEAGEGEVPNHDQSKFICIAGYDRNKIDGKCHKCRVGLFKSVSGERQCNLCPPNTVSTKLGAISCEEDDGIEQVVIIGVLAGGVVVLAGAGFAVFLYCRKHRKRSKQSPETSSKEGEYEGNGYCDESGSYNSPDKTISLSVSDSQTTVTSYSCSPTSGSKSTKDASSTFSLSQRGQHVLRNELHTEKWERNYFQYDKNEDWDEDGNREVDKCEEVNGDVYSYKDGDTDGNVYVDEDVDGNGYVNKCEEKNGNVDKNGEEDEDEDEDGDGNGEWDEGKDENDSNIQIYDTES